VKKVLITGSNGTIGRLLVASLSSRYQVASFDLPRQDGRKYGDVQAAIQNADSVIHLAWNTATDYAARASELVIDPDNYAMALNVYKAAAEAGVRRVIMASSVHADDFINTRGPALMDPYSLPTPTSPYGAGKVFVEALGRHMVAASAIEVICVRFGAVNQDERPHESPAYLRAVWLSSNDLVSLIGRCIEAPLPKRYAIIYGVSNNPGVMLDSRNQIGWIPVDSAPSRT
jgi:NAD+ dependent glucose-6-phosphate dehydrogenase